MFALALLFSLLLLCPGPPTINAQRREHAAELRGVVKGQFFVHMLHSAYFFPQTVDVKWSVSARGRPSLPHWLHLFPSRHRSIAFLLGTPVSPHTHFHIHVIARRLDTFDSVEQSFRIVANEDLRFNESTQQIAEIRVSNVEAEELLWGMGRDGRLKSLEKAIQSTFRGRNVNPYIFNILPGMSNQQADLYYQFGQKLKIGAIIQVGTQQHFHPKVLQLVRGIQLNPEYCVQNKLMPMDRHFRPDFVVDWCKFHLKNMTLLKDLEEPGGALHRKGGLGSAQKRPEAAGEGADGVDENTAWSGTMSEGRDVIAEHRQAQMPAPPAYYIWESVLVFPLLAVCCLLFVLCLSFIFFGRREGQHWRDYKTPKNQLDQYLNLRESQRHLREMSQQRQMASLSQTGREQSEALSIGTFLRPIGQQQEGGPTGAAQLLPNGHLASPDLHQHSLRSRPEYASGVSLSRSSIGKQTVAEAARANGSALHLYRYPPTEESDEGEEQEKEEEDRGKGRRSRESGGRGRHHLAN